MATWIIDPTHSEVNFKVKHLMISTVTGNFGTYEGSVETANEEDFAGAKVSFSADIDSISTGQEQRDGHLKSGDFYGNTKAGFDISGKINRQDFGLTWGAVTEAGGVVVSDEVRLAFNIQVSKQA